MSLAARLTVSALAALAAVLLGFSAVLYGLTRQHLYAEADARVAAALETLAAAAIDVGEHDVEWDPPDGFALGPDAGPVRWAVYDPAGGLVAASSPPPGDWSGLAAGVRDAGPWRVGTRRVGPTGTPRPTGKRDHHAALLLAAGVDVTDARADLGRLGLTLAGLSVAAWAVSGGLTIWLCRRALAPLRRMAVAAEGVTAETLDARLPTPGTGDDLARLGAAFNGVLDRLAEAFARQRGFAAEASHQLRTPLATLLGQVEVACRRDREPDEYRRVLHTVRAEAERLRQVVEALLFLARPDADAPPAERLDLADWLPRQAERWAGHPRAGDLRVEIEPAGPLVVAASPALLGQALDALVENALKYGDPGTPVVVAAGREDGGVALRVTDAGWGIPAADFARLFEPFFRSDAARQSGRPGVGLGLAVAHRIAVVLGGTLVARSEPGVGSRFTLRLPAA